MIIRSITTIFAVLLFNILAIGAEAKSVKEYSLTWKRGGIGIGTVSWILNGKKIGKGMEGMETLLKTLPEGPGKITFRIPDCEKFEEPMYTPPYNIFPLVFLLREKKYSLRYDWKNEHITIFKLTWRWKGDYPTGLFEDISEFYLNDQPIGTGEAAIEKILAEKKTRFASIQFIENGEIPGAGAYFGILQLPGKLGAKLIVNGFRREDYIIPKKGQK